MEATITGNRFNIHAARIVTREGGDMCPGMAPGSARRVEPDTAALPYAMLVPARGRCYISTMAETSPSSGVRRLVDSEVVEEASRMIRFGAAAMVQTVPNEPQFLFYGPGFEVRVNRTDPAADYPGKPE